MTRDEILILWPDEKFAFLTPEFDPAIVGVTYGAQEVVYCIDTMIDCLKGTRSENVDWVYHNCVDTPGITFIYTEMI